MGYGGAIPYHVGKTIEGTPSEGRQRQGRTFKGQTSDTINLFLLLLKKDTPLLDRDSLGSTLIGIMQRPSQVALLLI
jgi:hypothetical protein